MPRFSHLLWASCLSSAMCLSGCSNTPSANATHSTPIDPAYDSYYGMPPAKGQAGQAGGSARTQPATSSRHVDQVDSAPDTSIRVNPAAPQRYVVQKGDTLWGISRKFLNTPWHWPELWDKNRDIANPHLIRPGDVLHFGYAPAPQAHVGPQYTGGQGEKLVPRIRIERKGMGESLATLGAFLEWPRIMNDADIQSAPYIIDSRDHHTLAAPGEIIYAKNLRNARIGQRYAVYHPDKPIHDPETNALLGHQVKYGGYVRVDRLGPVATLTVLEMEGPIRPGDRLLPVERRHSELRAPIQVPSHKIRGQVAAFYDTDYLGASCTIVAINRGKRHGLKPGHTLGVYAAGNIVEDKYSQSWRGNKQRSPNPKVVLPPEKVANTILYSVYDNVSYGLITESGREVKHGDRIGNP